MAHKKFAVVLCGSGYKDGSEIRESVAALWALSQIGAQVQCFAPDEDQTEVVNCLTGETVPGEKRNMLVESARIARGQVLPLSKLEMKTFQGIVFPGGFGAAKNLCNFAAQGAQARVRPELESIVKEAYENRKPIGAICIAPAIVALALKGKNLELTLGKESEASQEIEKLGHKHIEKKPFDCHEDRVNRIVTTPAYMIDDAKLHEVFEGIKKLSECLWKLA